MAFVGSVSILSQAIRTPISEAESNAPSGSSGTTTAHLGLFQAEKIGDQLMAQHRYQAALEIYQMVEAPSAKLWNRMGVAYQLLLDPNDAVRCYKESIKLEPDNPHVLNDMATAFDQLEDHRQAEQLYRKAINLVPNSAIYLKNLGTNLLAQHKFEQGSAAYSEALSLDPHIFDSRNNPSMALPLADHAETNYARARSCAQAGQKECTLAYLTKALNEGSATPKRIAADGKFDALRSDPALQELLTRVH